MAILGKLLLKSDDADNLKGIEFKEGDIIDQRYLVRNVRKGFMGLVYIARDLRSDQTIAMKTFQRKFTWVESAIANFTREAEVWMRLGLHPNIVQATRILTIAGRPHIVMEFVTGSSLREMLRRGRLRFQHIVDFSIQICWGMQYAYDHCSIIHRDLKPDNVMITPEGVAKVTDFGLAQAVTRKKVRWGNADQPQREETRIVTHASDLFGGSQPYMSPEQRTPGSPLGTTSDIYSMGVMIYEMMIGDLPFKAATVAELKNLHCNVPPPVPSEVKPDLRRGCDHVILRCLAKHPDDRYQSFDELEHDLQWLRKYHLGEELPRQSQGHVAGEAAALDAKGIAHLSLKEHSAAQRCFRQAIDLEPTRATHWINLGICQMALLDYRDALKTYEYALTLNPTKDEEVRLNWLLGETHESLYQLREALDVYDRALVLDSKERRAWLGRGRVYSALALPREALQAFEFASKLDPSDPQTWRSIGFVMLEMNQIKNALPNFEQALKLNPRDALAWCGKGQCFIVAKRLADAKQAYETAYKLDPNLSDALIGLARVKGTNSL